MITQVGYSPVRRFMKEDFRSRVPTIIGTGEMKILFKKGEEIETCGGDSENTIVAYGEDNSYLVPNGLIHTTYYERIIIGDTLYLIERDKLIDYLDKFCKMDKNLLPEIGAIGHVIDREIIDLAGLEPATANFISERLKGIRF